MKRLVCFLIFVTISQIIKKQDFFRWWKMIEEQWRHCFTDVRLINRSLQRRSMAEKLFQSEREWEESGSNRTDVKETDFDNRAPQSITIARKRKKSVHSVQEFRSWNWMESKNVTNNLLKLFFFFIQRIIRSYMLLITTVSTECLPYRYFKPIWT